jgi:dTDP-4-dehydrorhamnose 3,5-epimerase
MNNVPEVISGGKFVDDRGPLSFVNDFNFEGVKRFYQVENHVAGFVRAWHGHKLEGKYVYVPRGAALIHAMPITNAPHMVVPRCQLDLVRVTLSSDTPKVLWIPPGYYNGFMNLTADTIVMFFSTTTLEESKGDDYRLEWSAFGEDLWQEDYR